MYDKLIKQLRVAADTEAVNHPTWNELMKQAADAIEERMKEYHTFKEAEIKLRKILPLLRCSGYSNRDELGTNIILAPECEEWTWVKFNASSGFLDLLGDLIVSGIDENEGDIRLWIETDDFNWFKPKEDE